MSVTAVFHDVTGLGVQVDDGAQEYRVVMVRVHDVLDEVVVAAEDAAAVFHGKLVGRFLWRG
jgi:hypothetical protein